jgi:hypothetical protein
MNFYIGRRQCECIPENDTYFGSGVLLEKAISKYGKQNFEKEIIILCSTYEELIEQEIKLVNTELIKNDMCYNLALGGHGGYTFYENRNYKHNDESRKKISESKKGKVRIDMIGNQKGKEFWTGRKRTSDDKKKKSDAAIKRMNNDCNPFGHVLQCPYCMKTGQLPNMKRWHFENCKQRIG